MKQRELKFRGKPKQTDKNDFVYGWGCFTDESERYFIIVDSKQFIQVEKIEQSIGRTDKNGKDIYEGDLARLVACGGNPEYIGKIVFHKGKFQAEHLLKNREKIKIVERSDIYNKWEIIGDIYVDNQPPNSCACGGLKIHESDYCKDCV